MGGGGTDGITRLNFTTLVFCVVWVFALETVLFIPTAGVAIVLLVLVAGEGASRATWRKGADRKLATGAIFESSRLRFRFPATGAPLLSTIASLEGLIAFDEEAWGFCLFAVGLERSTALITLFPVVAAASFRVP